MACSDVNIILVGVRGSVQMYNELIKAISGNKPEEPKKKLSFAQKFKAIAADHNKRRKRK